MKNKFKKDLIEFIENWGKPRFVETKLEINHDKYNSDEIDVIEFNGQRYVRESK